jgi:tight adherence protein B
MSGLSAAMLATGLSGSAGAVLIAAVVFVAAALLVWAIASLVTRERKRSIEQTLSIYTVGQLPTQGSARKSPATQELVETPLVQKAVTAVGEFAAEQGILQYVERKLAQAKLLVRPAEALFLYIVAAVVAFFLGLLGGLIWAIISFAIVAIVPWIVLSELARRRVNAFVSQIPDMLQLLATTLRSGFSLLQGFDTISRQIPDPVGDEMRHVVTEARLGRSLVDALGDLAQKMANRDFQWVVAAIGIQREVGGNLAELLDIVSDTMTERERLRREARTLTAEGRIGAIIIAILPIAIGLFVWLVNPSYIDPLFHDTAAEIFFYGAIILGVLGILWLRQIVTIEV